MARTAGFWVLRRAVMAPLVFVLAVLSVPVALLVLVLSPLVCLPLAVVHRDGPRWRAARLASMAMVYLFGEVVVMLAALVLWVACGFGWRRRDDWFITAHRRLLQALLGVLIALARPVFGFRVEVQEPVRHPEDLTVVFAERPLLVLARHAGPGASFALVHLLLSTYHRHVHVVLKDLLRLDPALDLLLTRTGCTWVNRARHRHARPAAPAADGAPGTSGSATASGPADSSQQAPEDDAAAAVRKAAEGLREHDVLLLFPEGADWTPLRHLAAVRRLHGRGLREQARAALAMPHVLPPRPRGTAAALLGAPDADVLVFTHTGHDELLDPAATWAALPLRQPLQMAWWRTPARALPRPDPQQPDQQPGQQANQQANQDAVMDWLQLTWRDIDAWIDEQQDVHALAEPDSPR